MTNEYTPTTEEVLDVALLGAMDAVGGEENLDIEEFKAQLARWLTAHDAGVRATALEEALDAGYIAGCEDGWDGGRYGVYDTNRVTENPFRAVQENPGKDNQ